MESHDWCWRWYPIMGRSCNIPSFVSDGNRQLNLKSTVCKGGGALHIPSSDGCSRAPRLTFVALIRN